MQVVKKELSVIFNQELGIGVRGSRLRGNDGFVGGNPTKAGQECGRAFVGVVEWQAAIKGGPGDGALTQGEESMAEQIGFVGLGIMGKPMARNLMTAGYELTVYDIVGEPVEELATEGATAASSSSEVAAATDKIITMLPDSADSERAILGPGGVLEGAKPGSIVIDMSSISPIMSQKIAAECERKGVEMLDAPVSGGEPGAIAGTLAIMVGGKQEIFRPMRGPAERDGRDGESDRGHWGRQHHQAGEPDNRGAEH